MPAVKDPQMKMRTEIQVRYIIIPALVLNRLICHFLCILRLNNGGKSVHPKDYTAGSGYLGVRIRCRVHVVSCLTFLTQYEAATG